MVSRVSASWTLVQRLSRQSARTALESVVGGDDALTSKDLQKDFLGVERTGIEPVTSGLQSRRSPS
jgi:hypothetical protein